MKYMITGFQSEGSAVSTDDVILPFVKTLSEFRDEVRLQQILYLFYFSSSTLHRKRQKLTTFGFSPYFR